MPEQAKNFTKRLVGSGKTGAAASDQTLSRANCKERTRSDSSLLAALERGERVGRESISDFDPGKYTNSAARQRVSPTACGDAESIL